MTKLTLLSATAAAFGLIAGTASAQTTSRDSTVDAFSKDTQSSSSSMPAVAGSAAVPSGAAVVAHQVHHRTRSHASGSSLPSGASESNITAGPK